MGSIAALHNDTAGLNAFAPETRKELDRIIGSSLSCSRSKAARRLAKQVVRSEILTLCAGGPCTTVQLLRGLRRKHTGYLIKHYLAPMMSEGLLVESGGLYSTPRTP